MAPTVPTGNPEEARESRMETTWYVPNEFAMALKAGRLLRGYTIGQVSHGTGIPTFRLRQFESGSLPTADEFGLVWRFLSSDPPPR